MVHPNWTHTDAPSTAVEIPIRATNRPTTTSRVSRSPAAIVGIALAIGVCAAWFGNGNTWRAQLQTQIDVRITSSGFEPNVVTVLPGDTIVWTNEEAIPHILETVPACAGEPHCLRTNTLFEGETDEFIVPLDITAGTYEYQSITTNTLAGTIIVNPAENVATTPDEPETEPIADEAVDPDAQPPADLQAQIEDMNDFIADSFAGEVAADDQGTPVPLESDLEEGRAVRIEASSTEEPPVIEVIDPPVPEPPIAIETSTPPPPPTPVPPAPSAPVQPVAIPVNTITNTQGPPTNDLTVASAPIIPRPLNNLGTAFKPSAPVLQQIEPRPQRQPDTGAGIWFVFGLSLVAMWFMSRREFA